MRRSTPSSASSNDSGPPRAQLLVMAKYPSPGSVKTRLASQVGAVAACRLYDAFVRDLADRLAAVELPLTWAFWPPDAPFASLVPGKRSVPQVGRDLGERLLGQPGRPGLGVLAVRSAGRHATPGRRAA